MSVNRYAYNELNVEIEHIQPEDIKILARVYENAFSTHFLGHMGHKFLVLFISEFVNSAGKYGYVAKFENEPIGLILATTLDNPFNNFYHENFLSLSLITVCRYLQDPFVRKHIGKRLVYVYTALKALGNTTNNKQDVKIRTIAPPRLLAIAVDEKYRGLGVASKLTNQFFKEMKHKGYKKVELTVLPWNQRAICFYKKDGWIKEDSSESSIVFSRLL